MNGACPFRTDCYRRNGGGRVVFCGALYAIFFYAMGRRAGSSLLLGMSFVAYAGVVACVGVLTHALDLNGIWWWLIACLLIGDLLAPPFIWRLTLAVHGNEPNDSAGGIQNDRCGRTVVRQRAR
jgi:hypothetical protein